MDWVDLLGELGKDRRRAWGCGNPADWRYRRVCIGTLADGRIFVECVGQVGSGGWLADDEQQAEAYARTLMTPGDEPWERVPASFDRLGQPADGGNWKRTGGRWFAVADGEP